AVEQEWPRNFSLGSQRRSCPAHARDTRKNRLFARDQITRNDTRYIRVARLCGSRLDRFCYAVSCTAGDRDSFATTDEESPRSVTELHERYRARDWEADEPDPRINLPGTSGRGPVRAEPRCRNRAKPSHSHRNWL